MANIVKTVVSGEVITAADWNAEFLNIYTGTIDRSDGRWGSNNDIPVTFGSGQQCSLTWNTTQTSDALVLGLSKDSGASNQLIICEEGDKATNWAYAASTDPTVIIHSNSTTAANYLSLSHNDTDAIIKAGSGGILMYAANLLTASFSASATWRCLIFNTADLGTGVGPYVELRYNNNATTPAAGHLKFWDKGGAYYYVWVDAAGKLRIGQDAPTTANDTSGTIVGTQGA